MSDDDGSVGESGGGSFAGSNRGNDSGSENSSDDDSEQMCEVTGTRQTTPRKKGVDSRQTTKTKLRLKWSSGGAPDLRELVGTAAHPP